MVLLIVGNERQQQITIALEQYKMVDSDVIG